MKNETRAKNRRNRNRKATRLNVVSVLKASESEPNSPAGEVPCAYFFRLFCTRDGGTGYAAKLIEGLSLIDATSILPFVYQLYYHTSKNN